MKVGADGSNYLGIYNLGYVSQLIQQYTTK